ncbi:L-arabinose isomerase [Pedobacter sp. UYEF25]
MFNNNTVKIGLFGIGLEVYWRQFQGLKDRLNGYLKIVADNIEALDVAIVNMGMVDTAEKSFEAGDLFKAEDVDLIFIYVSTYALSANVLPAVRKAGVPIIILNLSPEASIDYQVFNKLADRTTMTGEWLAHCSACAVPEIANVFKRCNIPFYQVTGMLINDEYVWKEINQWIEASRVARIMFYNRLGLMGGYYGGMMDIYTDLTLQNSTFGGHMEVIEVDELSGLVALVNEEEIENKLTEIQKEFEIQDDCEAHELRRAAKTAVALDKIVAKYQLGSLAYYHKGNGNSANESTISSIILGTSLLTGRNIPVAGEFEVKNVQAMKIIDSFGAGGSFTEYYAMDYKDDVVLMGHDGPCHPRIAEGKVKVRPLQVYHGKVGRGLSVEMSVSHGEVTLLSVVEVGDGTIKFLVAEGESVSGQNLAIGNTNSRYKFSVGARNFVELWSEQGPAHHCAIGKGHIAAKIKKLGKILKIETVQVC